MNDSIPSARRPAIQSFVTQMTNNSTNIQAIRRIVDMDLSHNAAHPYTASPLSSFNIDTTTLRGVTIHIFNRCDNSQPRWQLATNDPVAVIQCFRENMGSSIRDAARYLLSYGIAFQTFVCRTDISRQSPPATYPSHSLGWRPPDYKPSTREYCNYEDLRDNLLRRPYGRAALLQGGIVWRLALHALQFPTDAELLVTQGPSEDALAMGTAELLNGDVLELFDDGLGDEEIDLICGVYKWSTGMYLTINYTNIF